MATASTLFACSFTRRNCPHEPLFHDAYQRTNRTKGTKILRCFPHCCPRHIDRSYCGGPVYMQVDLVSDDNCVEDASLCVFAHFRPLVERGFEIGHDVPRALFRDDQQTDTNPAGEWIGARLMASADHTTWMFEVNPSGRWYYQWESGATKAQRATEHVFEAFVLQLDAASEKCRVVAKAVSREFKMVSFRRAPSETKSGGSEGAEEVSSRSQKVGLVAEAETDEALASSRWSYRDSVDSALSTDAEMASQIRPLASGHLSSTEAVPLAAPLERLQNTDQVHGADAAPLSLLPRSEIVQVSQDVGILLDFLQVIPSTALELVVPEIRQIVLPAFVDRFASGGRLSQLFTPHQGAHTCQTSPKLLTRSTLRLALWFLFDRELAQAQEAFLNRASAGLLDKVALYESYFSWLDSLQHYVHDQLALTSSTLTLPSLAKDARQCILGRAHSSSHPNASLCRGLEPFVAQAREVFLAGGDLNLRRRSLNSSQSGLDSQTSPQYRLRVFAATWRADIQSIRWRDSTLSPTTNCCPSAFVMMWAWRQALGFSISVDQDSVSPTLTISSIWNPARRASMNSATRGSRLVLDGKPRWLRVYPSGESTSSVELGTQRLGHYVASFRAETRELLVNCYTWPSQLNPSPDSACYCLRWCLRRVNEDSSGPGAELEVLVAVERGLVRSGVDAEALDERPLMQKLQAVSQWTTVASLQYACYRQTEI